MPIDRIGKGGGVPPHVPGSPGASGPTAASPGKPFEVDPAKSATGAQKAEGAGAVSASSALDQLRAGKIDLNQYVDLKLDEATSHLHGLHASELQQIRAMLRDKIVQDPQIVDLVRQATGQIPEPTDE